MYTDIEHTGDTSTPETGTGEQRQKQSQIFLVRVWTEDGERGGMEWRGKVQQVLTAEARCFDNWPALVEFLTTMPPVPPADRTLGTLTPGPEQQT